MGKTSRDRKSVSTPNSAAGTGARENWIRTLLLGTAAGFLTTPLIGIVAGFLLLFGGIFLAVSWQVGVQPLIDAQHYASFTGRATGRIVESWVALDFDPATVRKQDTYWEPSAKISPCAVVEYGNDWGAPMRRAFCGNRFAFSEDFRLDDWVTLAPEIPFAFVRDASGFAIEEMRMGKIAFDWLKSHPPSSNFMLSTPPPTSALAAMKQRFDRPGDIALASWSMPFPVFPLAFDPQHPQEAMPAKYMEDRRDAFFFMGLVFAAIFAVPGLFVWRMGIGFLFGDQRPAVVWALTIGLLFALPWWSESLPILLGHVNKNWASIGSDMLDDINRTTRLIASAPDAASQAHGERIVLHVDQNAYADTFGRIAFHLPTPRPSSPDAARAALRAQVSVYVAGLDSEPRAVLFRRLRQLSDAGLNNVQNLFAAAAEDTLRDADANAAAHKAARSFLIFASGGTYYEDQLDKLEVAPRVQ